MQYFFYVICQAVSIFLQVVLWAMMIRAIMSFLGKNEEENRFMFFLALVTEPIIAPVRALLSVFGIGENSPMDIGFFVTAILLSALSYVLPQIPI